MTSTKGLKMYLNEEHLHLLKRKTEELLSYKEFLPWMKARTDIYGIVMNIETFFTAKENFSKDLYPYVIERIQKKVNSMEFSVNELIENLIDYLPVFTDFFKKSNETQKVEHIISNYISDLAGAFKKVVDFLIYIVNEIDRINYTFNVTKDYSFLNAHISLGKFL